MASKKTEFLTAPAARIYHFFHPSRLKKTLHKAIGLVAGGPAPKATAHSHVAASHAPAAAAHAPKAAAHVPKAVAHAPVAAAPEPVKKKFADYALHATILSDVTAAGYLHPTPIQAACLADALAGKDVIGLAQTGTGKTAAFALPMIQRVARRADMAALVLAPTRELAQQIAAGFKVLGKSSDVRVAVVVGGIPIQEDYKALQAWPNVLIATPGRLIDHIQSRTISLKEVEILAVDEADRMYDMGFIPQIRRIIAELPETRQTLMFTATMPDEVEKIARKNMRDPVRVQVGVQAPVDRAEQKLFHVREDEKMALLMKLLREEKKGRVLVFARTKIKVERLSQAVRRSFGSKVARLHSDREQSQRDEAMAGFRDGRYQILIATDVAARGLDVADIAHVINYDFPAAPDDYIHRIGRTARVAASGLATSFVTEHDHVCLKRLVRMVPMPPSAAIPESAASSAQSHEKRPGGHRARRSRTGRSAPRRANPK